MRVNFGHRERDRLAPTVPLTLLRTAQWSTSRASCFAPGEEDPLHTLNRRLGGPQRQVGRPGEKSLAEGIRNPDLLARKTVCARVCVCACVCRGAQNLQSVGAES